MDERVLLIEDDRSIRDIATLGLTRAGFRVEAAADGRTGLERALAERFDVIVLDVMLPGLDGYEVCREVRTRSRVPIVMLTARADTVDVVVGLESGADDYVTKPFDMPVLVARLRAVLRRAAAAPAGEPRLVVGDLEIDAAAHVARRHGHDLDLTATEFRLLLELARHPRQVLTREVLLDRVWSYDYLGDSRMVDVAMQRLRGKVEPDPAHPVLLKTVRGVGYRLDPPPRRDE